MHLNCNGESIGNVEHVEWKEKEVDQKGGTVTFMAPFDFDWEARQNAFLELADDDDDERYILHQIKNIDRGGAGTFIVARYKEMAT